MNLIVLSDMYPKHYSPLSGNFVEEQICALKHVIDGNIAVVSPVPWSSRFLWFKKKWKEYGRTEKERVEKGIKVYHPRYLVIPGKTYFPFQGIFMYLSTKSLIKKLLKVNKGNTILHTHAILPNGLAGVLLKSKFKIPHICTIHGSDINIYPFRNKLSLALTKYVLKKSDHLVTVSDKLKEKTLYIENNLNNIVTVYNGADPKKFKPLPKEIAKQKLGITNNNKIIMYIGSLIPLKNVNNLIKAFAKLQKNKIRDDIALFLMGDGNRKEELHSLTRTLEIENKVFFLGEKDNDEVPLWLNVTDIFVLPSLSEGFPLVIPEAMMCGVPIVATDVGGVSEAIVNKTTGLLVKPNDIDSLAEAIHFYLNNEKFTQYVIKNAKRISTNFTWDKNAEKYFSIYKSLLNYSSTPH